ncbi:vesicle transport protein GOT1B-like isoform X2 [Syngnathoides biaculeatus]|uniref:vesicle transport protein GOT1B-like isoform X2 n=1 Tax=Syngnathoides biaculeatus TaxID=300417 RepID=UPI002ADD3E04|nr:vesicle transport protein GOT1B-like isoform X2 [Syngnathoides biaculeatus]
MISLTDSQKIGMGLTGFGLFFLVFGMMLFFDKALLAIGNILFVSGLSFVIGLERTFRFFFQRHKAKATGFFLGEVLAVLIGWPVVGVLLEIYGFFLLFRSVIKGGLALAPSLCRSCSSSVCPGPSEDSSRWRWASSGGSRCWARCSVCRPSGRQVSRSRGRDSRSFDLLFLFDESGCG